MPNKINENNSEIDIIYKKSRNTRDKLKIFGEEFVKNNKDKCKIIYNNKEYELKEYLEDIPNDNRGKRVRNKRIILC